GMSDPWYCHSGVMDSNKDTTTFALWDVLIVGGFAAYSLWRSIKSPADLIPGWIRAGVVVGSLLAVSIVARTAYLGGTIIHEAPVLQLKQPPPGLPPGVAAEKKDSAGK